MGDAVVKRKHKFFTFRKLLFCLFLLFGICIILVTILYTVPQVSSYIGNHTYISPLASRFSLHEALGTQFSKEMVREKVKKAGFTIKEIDDYDNGYIVILESEEKILFSKKKSLDVQISSLQLISSRFTIEGKQFEQLDLRFDRPVVTPK